MKMRSGYTPSYLLYGKEMNNTLERLVEQGEQEWTTVDDWIAHKVKSMALAMKLSIARRDYLKSRRNEDEKEQKKTEYETGDLVLIWRQNYCTGTELAKKFRTNWRGPYEVVSKSRSTSMLESEEFRN